MAELNFLPQDQIQNKKLRTTSGKLRLVVAVFGIICLGLGIGGTAYILYKGRSISALESEQTQLKNEVLAQESTEQTYVYLKDRLARIAAINQKHPNNGLFLAQKTSLDTFPTSSSLRQLSLSDSESSFSVTAPDTQSLDQVIEQLKNPALSGGYIDSLSFNAASGYQLKIILK